MAVFKCKMCGADLNITEDIKITECEYCGSTQTLPSIDNEKKLNLFNRANRLRINSEFDMASAVYENIVAEFPEEAEAYWGLCLCNYGIEYVDDPATGRKMPTCHRASFESIEKDENFSLAMEYADISARKVYRDEAKEIDRIMDEILSISKNEDPYDVFICYKETDSETGARTVDSVLAYDIYDALTAKGYKVFFSRVTLEEKLGRQYEPYIFAALNSAKIMLTIGTKYEYFHAVWVKNEWSRFLKLMAKDKEKLLIPCYKDMDAYDLPDKFRKLQAQDLGKLGAVQDIVRGIEKIIPLNKPESTPAKPQTVTVAGVNIDSLLKRGFMALEDGKFDDAKIHFDKVLDADAECAGAYLGLAMATERFTEKRDFAFKSCLDNSYYKRAKQFADNNLLSELTAFENEAEEARRLEEEARRLEEEARKLEEEAKCNAKKEEKYIKANTFLEKGDYHSAIELLSSLGDYKNSKQLLDNINYVSFVSVKQNGKWGFIDRNGTFVINPMFDNAHDFTKNGLARVEQNGKDGFIDETGAFVIKPMFDFAYSFAENGLATVKQNGEYGFIDETGAFVIKPMFDDAYSFDENGLARVKQNGKRGLINETGAFVIKPMFDFVSSFDENGLALVEQNGKYGFINETGAFVIKPMFDEAWSFAKNGLVRVKQNGKWGFIDRTGAFVIEPMFDEASSFDENGLASVKQNGKWGLINETGAFVIEPMFDTAAIFAENGLAKVEQNGKYGFIDETGAFVIEPMFDTASSFAKNGLATVEQNEKWGFIDETGAFVIDPMFDSASSFAENGLATVWQNGKWGFIDETGAFVIEPMFDGTGSFSIILQADIEATKERQKIIEQKIIKQKMTESRMQQGLCIHCGGEFKGLFTKKCTKCGKEKDY